MRVLISTGAFPYPPGEQFLEAEVGYWSGLAGKDVFILPGSGKGKPRDLPADIEVRIGKELGFQAKIYYSVRALFSRLLWREVTYLLGIRKATAPKLFSAVKSVALTLRAKHEILYRIRDIQPIGLAYSYWNNESAYALSLLKRQGLIECLVSRAHGYDLYEQRRPEEYMPLKRQFISDFDRVYAISDGALSYLRDTYGFPESCLQVSRLGVAIPNARTRPSDDGVLRLLSLSFCVPVKRIDRIIEAIGYACHANKALVIDWVHIGDGPLKSALEIRARKKLGELDNLTYAFVGEMKHPEVMAYMSNSAVDVFINSSASEGVPVSIMEAMACGIPAIAPNVGGVAELVNEQTGVLLTEEMLPADVFDAISKLTGDRAEIFRVGARSFVESIYSAEKNYSRFVAGCINLVDAIPRIPRL